MTFLSSSSLTGQGKQASFLAHRTLWHALHYLTTTQHIWVELMSSDTSSYSDHFLRADQAVSPLAAAMKASLLVVFVAIAVHLGTRNVGAAGNLKPAFQHCLATSWKELSRHERMVDILEQKWAHLLPCLQQCYKQFTLSKAAAGGMH